MRSPRWVRWIGMAVLIAMPGACAYCVEKALPPQCIEHTDFCARYFSENNLTSAEARCKLAIDSGRNGKVKPIPAVARKYDPYRPMRFRRSMKDLPFASPVSPACPDSRA